MQLPVLFDTRDGIVQADPWSWIQFDLSTSASECMWIQAQHPHVAKCTAALFQYQMCEFVFVD